MAHIKDLHLHMLQMVLAYFYHGTTKRCNLQGFRQLLPPAAVCRVWRECMLPYIYYIAHLEYHIKKTDEDKETAQPKYERKSNIDLIVSQRFSSAVRQLRIESPRCPLKFSEVIHGLDAFGFSSNHWRTVNALRIHVALEGVAASDSPPSSGDNEALAAQLTEYFGRHLPNIGDLHIQIFPQPNAARFLSNKLVNLYISQLHSLRCFPAPITFSCHSFSSTIRRLRVGIAPGVTNRLPQLLASPLEILELFDIPHNFAWWTFIGAATTHVEFTNLRELELQFRKLPENKEESNSSNRQMRTNAISAFDIGNRKLSFPMLAELRILYSPYNDGSFYSAFIDSPLQYVKIQSSFKSVQYMDPRILFNVSGIRFNIRSVSPDDYSDYVKFYCKLLGTPSNARTVWLNVYNSSVPLPTPGTIEWTSLEHLTLQTNIRLVSTIQIITQLPKLHTLRVENIIDELNEAGANLQAILSKISIQIQPITANVKSFSIYSLPTRIGSVSYFPSRLPLVFSLDIMRYVTVLIRSLNKVVVPDLYVSDIKEFSVRYEDLFPHLHDLQVLGASEEHD